MHLFCESNKLFKRATNKNKTLPPSSGATCREQRVQVHKKGVLQISVCHTAYNYKGTSIVIIHLRTTLTLYLGLRLSRMGLRSGTFL